MTLEEALRGARSFVLEAGECYPSIGLDLLTRLRDTTDTKDDLLHAVALLDAATPGQWSFGQWVDGATLTEAGVVYEFNRKVPEVCAVIGRALQRHLAQGVRYGADGYQPKPGLSSKNFEEQAAAHGFDLEK